MFPRDRPRRLRYNPILRDLVAETSLSGDDLIYPIFVKDGDTEPIASMPGQYRYGIDDLGALAEGLVEKGIRSVLMFGIPRSRSPDAHDAYASDGVVQRALARMRDATDDLLLITDVCLCQYIDTGHCGIVSGGGMVDNDRSLPLLSRIALSHVRAGADVVAPSDMMDGRVKAIRDALDGEGCEHIPIISYSAKYASAFYGPFRDACNSAPRSGDRRSYQMDNRNSDEALKEVLADIEEGADIVMVKPALCYLDVIRRVRDAVKVPVMAYNVSGEYSMIKAAASQGCFDERDIVLETLFGIKRAGADLIATYFAPDIIGEL
ncbi:MAG TPA: porphobilinogen synthase [Candidatus Methanofastidiosa archaeon]|nr:porphobilinogen synthase [Candidatus Methanofastidiosa archaeon]